jgi:hypothetical protein
MKKTFLIGLVILVIITLLFFDYRSKKDKFEVLKKEYELSIGFEQTVGLISSYFLEHGWFPDSLQQLDTIFNHEIHVKNFEDIRETRHRFFVDPFSGKFYHYIPAINEKYGKPEGYYLLSAGIDSKINNKENKGTLKLHDSVSFSYFDYYFGKKDLLVDQRSIEDWISSDGFDLTFDDLAENYNLDHRRHAALHGLIEFYGVVDSVNTDHFTVIDRQKKGVCYLAPSVDKLAITSGDTVQVKGIYNRVSVDPDTTFTFLNCVILEKK